MRGSRVAVASAVVLLAAAVGLSAEGTPFAGAGLPTADLSLTKSDSPDPVAAGGSLTYTLTVRNQGPSSSGLVSVSDPLPASVTFTSASPGCQYFSSGGTVRCALGPIASGASVQVAIQVVANQPGTILNSATVREEASDPDPSDNSASAETAVQGGPPPPADTTP